jgi:hypothetical protein
VWWHMSQQHFWVQAYSSNDVAVLGFFSKEAGDSLAEVFAFNCELFTAPLDLCRWQMRDEKVWYQLPIAE